MRFLSILAFGFLITSCCCRDQNEMTRYHEDGRAKPVVLVRQMIDTSSFDAPWSVSEELTGMLFDRLSNNGQIFVSKSEDAAFTENPFSKETSWMRQEFPEQEFVVFLELVEHETVPLDKSKRDLPPQEASMNLNTAVRLRVVDLRGASPKVILQETVKESFFIPKTLLPTNYNLVTWGSPEYDETPMKNAHVSLVNEIAERVTDYILLAKSR